MLFVKMTKNKLGSNDGLTTRHYAVGETYELSDSLAASFIKEGVAEAAEAAEGEKAAKVPANKAVKAAPANKAQ